MAEPVVQNVQTNTSNLPAYAEPYFTNLLQRGQGESYRDYTAFPGQRIADFTPGQVGAQQGAFDLQRPGQFGDATALAGASGIGSLNAGQYNPTSFNYNSVNAPSVQDYQMGPAGTFGQAQADQYMSPYFQNVVDAQKREAITDAQKTQLMTNLGAARQGTYGGARQLLAGTERERALGLNLSDIQAKGLQSAYENAQQQYERDRQMGYNVNNTNMSSSLSTQNLRTEAGLRALLANQTAGIDAQRMGEQSRQFGTSAGLQGIAQALQSAQTLGTLGTQQQTSDLQRIQAQAAAGAEQQNLDQQYLDTDYADFLRQRDYPTELLSQYSSILRGLPVDLNSTQTSYAPPPSMASQVGGLGLGALSLYNLTK